MSSLGNPRRRAFCVADKEPPVCFTADARWLDDEVPTWVPKWAARSDAADRLRVTAINAWLRIESIVLQRRLARDVKGMRI